MGILKHTGSEASLNSTGFLIPGEREWHVDISRFWHFESDEKEDKVAIRRKSCRVLIIYLNHPKVT